MNTLHGDDEDGDDDPHKNNEEDHPNNDIDGNEPRDDENISDLAEQDETLDNNEDCDEEKQPDNESGDNTNWSQSATNYDDSTTIARPAILAAQSIVNVCLHHVCKWHIFYYSFKYLLTSNYKIAYNKEW